MSAKRRVPVDRLLEVLGIRAKREGRKWVSVCPSPDHDDRHPSWCIVDDGGARHGSHRCYACGFGGGPWELVAAVRGLSLELDERGRCEAGEWCWEHVFGGATRELEDRDVPELRVVLPTVAPAEMRIPNHVRIPSVDGTDWHPRALAYLESRGIPEWQRVRWHIGYATLGQCAWRVFVPVYTRGLLLSYVARAFIEDGRSRYDAAQPSRDRGARPSAALFGEPGFDLDVRVGCATEGVFKALAMERAAAPNPCAVLGATNLGPEKVELLAQFEALLVATDPDPAGDKCAEAISDAVVRYTEPIRVELERSPDDATEEENGAAWRAAIARALPGLRARRVRRVGAT